MTEIPDLEGKLQQLTLRQCQVLYWVCREQLYKHIGPAFGVDEETIQKDMSHIYKVLGIPTNIHCRQIRALFFDSVCPVHVDLVQNPDAGCPARSVVEYPELPPYIDPDLLQLVRRDWAQLMEVANRR